MATTPKFHDLEDEYQRLWDTMKITKLQKSMVKQVNQILAGRDQYESVEKETSVPWWFVGIVHVLESNGDFSTHLHNGDPLKDRTKHVPAGRPKHGSPPFTWHESAVDALEMHGFDNIKYWTIPRILFELERYNGWGYRMHHDHVLSPYLWSGSTHYTKGKYVRDGKFDDDAVSKQVGCALLLRGLWAVAEDERDATKAVAAKQARDEARDMAEAESRARGVEVQTQPSVHWEDIAISMIQAVDRLLHSVETLVEKLNEAHK